MWFGSSLVATSCPTLCNPMDCSPPGSSLHGISQARILEWVAVSFSRGFSWPRGQTQVSCTVGRLFMDWPTREAQCGLDYGKKDWRRDFAIIIVKYQWALVLGMWLKGTGAFCQRQTICEKQRRCEGPRFWGEVEGQGEVQSWTDRWKAERGSSRWSCRRDWG